MIVNDLFIVILNCNECPLWVESRLSDLYPASPFKLVCRPLFGIMTLADIFDKKIFSSRFFTHKQLGPFHQIDKVSQLRNLVYRKIPVPKIAQSHFVRVY